jgi:hypothetical protein
VEFQEVHIVLQAIGYCGSEQTLPSEAVSTSLPTCKGDWGADQWHADVNTKNVQYIIADYILHLG